MSNAFLLTRSLVNASLGQTSYTMLTAFIALIVSIAYSESNYCDYSTSVEWRRLGDPMAAANIKECEDLCDVRKETCTAVFYNATRKKCALLYDPGNAGAPMCTYPNPAIRKRPSSTKPCTEIGKATGKVIGSTCYFATDEKWAFQYDEIQAQNDVCYCYSGRREAHLAHILTKETYTALKQSGILTPDEVYLGGGRQVPPSTVSCACDMSSPSYCPHCQNWYWVDRHGNAVASISMGLWKSGEPNNGIPHGKGEKVAGIFSNGLNDISWDAYSHILCQFEG